MYPCMMPPRDSRRVSHPHDERIVIRKSRLRRALAKLTISFRT